MDSCVPAPLFAEHDDAEDEDEDDEDDEREEGVGWRRWKLSTTPIRLRTTSPSRFAETLGLLLLLLPSSGEGGAVAAAAGAWRSIAKRNTDEVIFSTNGRWWSNAETMAFI